MLSLPPRYLEGCKSLSIRTLVRLVTKITTLFSQKIPKILFNFLLTKVTRILIINKL